MCASKTKTFNSQVYSLACNRLKLKRREKVIFYRLLGFLIRNDKPFPYSVASLSALTSYSRSSIFECFNILENLRLIERIGFSTQVKYAKGNILKRICSLVQKRINNKHNYWCGLYKSSTPVQKRINNKQSDLYKSSTPVQFLDRFVLTSPETGYNKTSFLLKHKEKDLLVLKVKYNEYAQRIICDRKLGLTTGNIQLLEFEEWVENI